MKVLTTPFCSVFARVAVKDGKKALPVHLIERSNESMRILHESSWTLSMSYCARILGVLGPVRGWILRGSVDLLVGQLVEDWCRDRAPFGHHRAARPGRYLWEVRCPWGTWMGGNRGKDGDCLGRDDEGGKQARSPHWPEGGSDLPLTDVSARTSLLA